jgi:beta-glucosidase
VPIYYNHKNTGRPVMSEPDSVFWSHYMDEKNSPLYPFGFGLSYSKFEYSDLQLSNNSFAKNGKIEVSIKITNKSKVPGKEVVQLYIRDLIGSVTRPVKELKGFEMIELQPNETKKVVFLIDEKTIQYFTANSKWEAEPGDFKVFIGGNSEKTSEANFQYTN